MAVAVYIFVLFLFLPLAKMKGVDDYLTSVLHTLDKIVDFYQNEFQDLNVDGLFGLRTVEGHTGAISKQYDDGRLPHLSKDVILQIKDLKARSSKICSDALKHVEKKDKYYFTSMGFLVNTPWDKYDEMLRKVNLSWEWKPHTYTDAKSKVVLTEEVSDVCMSELMGSHKVDGEACDISEKCVHTMTTAGLVGYGITHQLLWIMLAEKMGCTKELEKVLEGIGRHNRTLLHEELCSNNYIQLQKTLASLPNRTVVPALQDMFLEQLFVCPSLGYYEFLELGYLMDVLSWQLPAGCYGKMPHPKNHLNRNDKWSKLMGKFEDDYVDDDSNYDGADKDLDNEMMRKDVNDSRLEFERKWKETFKDLDVGKQEMEKQEFEMKRNKGRKLLVEQSMSGDCLAHKTAVASGALVLYLRYLCREDAKVIFSTKPSQRTTLQYPKQPITNHKPVLQPLRAGQNNMLQPLGAGQNNMIQPLGAGQNNMLQPLGVGQNNMIQPLGAGQNNMIQPLGAGQNNMIQPLGAGQNNMIQPLGVGQNNMIQPFGAGQNNMIQLLGAGQKDIMQPLGTGQQNMDQSELGVVGKGGANAKIDQNPVQNIPDVNAVNGDNVDSANENGNLNSVQGMKLKDAFVQVTENNNHLALNNKETENYGNEYDENGDNDDENNDDDYNADNDNANDNIDVGKVKVGDINNDYENDEYDNNDDGAIDDNADDDDEYDNDDNYPINRDDAGDDLGQYDDGGNDDDYDDDDYDANNDQNANKDQNANIPPHIHARNMGNAKSRDYDGKFDNSDRNNPVKDYDDDEEVDDYAYDDEEEEKAHVEESRGKNIVKDQNQGNSYVFKDISNQNESLSYSSFFVMSAISIIVLFILYRCLRKRRLNRVCVGHKYV